MTRFEKVTEGFWQDFDEIGSLLIESEIRIDRKTKEESEVFLVVGITKFGARCPAPIFEADSIEDAETFIASMFKVRA